MKESSKRDQYTVVLEDLRSDFRIFGEALMGVDGKVDKVDNKVESVKIEVAGLSKRVEGVESDLDFIKSELALIRHNQVTRDEFKFLETRVLRLEKQRH